MIKHYSFTGESPALALQKAKDELGEDLTLEATKQIRPKTLNQKAIYEIIVGREEKNDEPLKSVLNEQNFTIENEISNAKTKDTKNTNFLNVIQNFNNQNFTDPLDEQERKNAIKRQIQAYTNLGKKQNNFSGANLNASPSDTKKAKDDEDIALSFSKTAEQIAQLANITPANTNDYDEKMKNMQKDLEKKVDKLGDQLLLIADAMWKDGATNRGDINIPREFATIYKKAASSGMKSEHLKQIMEVTIANMPSKMISNPAAVERYFYFLLEKMLPRKKTHDIANKQRIMMLVGPTGVGKTTTLSKLAYKYAYGGQKRLKTGIITLDNYRIGAVEQLAQYAQVMRMRMIEAINIDEFKSALSLLSDCDLILVDTVGSSQYDTQKLANLKEILIGSGADIDVQLVLSASTKTEDLLEIYESFSIMNIDSLIITKLDETKILGNIFSLVYETNTPINFFSIGQNVPDDIEIAENTRLVKCVLEGLGNGSSK